MKEEILFLSQKKYLLTALLAQKMLEQGNSSENALNLAVFTTKSGGFVVFFSGINCDLYHYAGNNPVKYVDPDGKDIQTIYLGGFGAKLIDGGDVSAGISWDDNGNFALAITGNIGIEIEAKVDIPFTPAGSISTEKNLNDLKGIGAFKVDGSASIYGQEANVGIVFGINVDNESSEITGWNVGIVGGGVIFASGTLYIMLKHGIGDLVEKYNQLDSASQKEFMHEIKNSQQMPHEIKEEIISTI